MNQRLWRLNDYDNYDYDDDYDDYGEYDGYDDYEDYAKYEDYDYDDDYDKYDDVYDVLNSTQLLMQNSHSLLLCSLSSARVSIGQGVWLTEWIADGNTCSVERRKNISQSSISLR